MRKEYYQENKEEIKRKSLLLKQTKDNGFYRKWCNMHDRLNRKKGKDYKNYSKRGIKCLWKTYEHFKEDMFPSYLVHLEKFGKEETTLDRIDNNGNYYKQNCKWSTRKEQALNRTTSVRYKYDSLKNKTRKNYVIFDLTDNMSNLEQAIFLGLELLSAEDFPLSNIKNKLKYENKKR
jgi:hypothetical protein